MDIIYRHLIDNEITVSLFKPFNRYQKVEQCWRIEDGKWILKDISFVEDWGSSEKSFLVDCLKKTVHTKGVVWGAFEKDLLVGFASVENEPFGTKERYLQLSSLHVSNEFRGLGIGKVLFNMIAQSSLNMGAQKLYISAHSSKQSQAFYKSVGCVEAKEINKIFVEKEPCDCQLEYNLLEI